MKLINHLGLLTAKPIIYSSNFKLLFSGGKYFAYDENCIGFSGFLDNLVIESKIEISKKKRIFVEFDINKNDKKKLINKGFVVIRALCEYEEKSLKSEAKKNNCHFVFFNRNIIKVI